MLIFNAPVPLSAYIDVACIPALTQLSATLSLSTTLTAVFMSRRVHFVKGADSLLISLASFRSGVFKYAASLKWKRSITC
uniref:Uncharacterized protein n=1 Tax=Parascaris equorum TaxID=6256 RepID=A0A914SHK4_PAREQ